MPFAQGHVALPGTADVLRVLHHVLTARPRASQAPPSAKLALDSPDLVAVGDPLVVSVEVAEGDPNLSLLVTVEAAANARRRWQRSPEHRDGELIARFDGLPEGDYVVSVGAAIRRPDVRPVWDLVTVADAARR